MSNQCKSNNKDESQLLNHLNEPTYILHDKENELQNNCKSSLPKNKINYINQWITDIDESNSEISSHDNDNTVYSSSVVDDDEEFDEKINSLPRENEINNTITNNLNYLQNKFNSTSTNNEQTIENLTIENSKNVHIGNVTYITGPIHVTQHNDNDGNTRKTINSKVENNVSERQEMNSNNIFIGSINRAISSIILTFIDRRTWLAQKPFEPYDYLQGPADFVIISHTATEMGTTQAENIFLIRHIQCYHIESNRWNDISYNFLIGCDGNIYEGRGWGVVGAHTLGYNSKSLGISFVGCFMRELPSTVSLDVCKNLIKRGIELGHISQNYKLLAHCQCRPTESPGKRLFDEIKCWPNFCDDI